MEGSRLSPHLAPSIPGVRGLAPAPASSTALRLQTGARRVRRGSGGRPPAPATDATPVSARAPGPARLPDGAGSASLARAHGPQRPRDRAGTTPCHPTTASHRTSRPRGCGAPPRPSSPARPTPPGGRSAAGEPIGSGGCRWTRAAFPGRRTRRRPETSWSSSATVPPRRSSPTTRPPRWPPCAGSTGRASRRARSAPSGLRPAPRSSTTTSRGPAPRGLPPWPRRSPGCTPSRRRPACAGRSRGPRACAGGSAP